MLENPRVKNMAKREVREEKHVVITSVGITLILKPALLVATENKLN